MLGSCQEYFTKSQQAPGQALAVPDALTLGSYSERLDDSTAKTHSSPTLRAEGGGNRLVQHEDTDRVSGSLCIASSGLGSGPGCIYVPSTHFSSLPISQHSISSLGHLPQIFICHLLRFQFGDQKSNLSCIFSRFIFYASQHRLTTKITSNVLQSLQTQVQQ